MTGELARRLLDLGYVNLFQRLDDEALTALWSEDGIPASLRRLALDGAEDPRARFLAAEAVLSRASDSFAADEQPALAALYATALQQQLTGSANEWSLPGQSLGRAGEHLLALGEAAVPALAALLDDETPLVYEGSQEAMAADAYGYRVKDLAAQFVAGITGLAFTAAATPAARDAAIAALQIRPA